MLSDDDDPASYLDSASILQPPSPIAHASDFQKF